MTVEKPDWNQELDSAISLIEDIMPLVGEKALAYSLLHDEKNAADMIIVDRALHSIAGILRRVSGMVVSDMARTAEQNFHNVFSAALAGVELVRHSKEQE